MSGAPERDPNEGQSRHPPKRGKPATIIRIFRTFKRYKNRQRRRYQKDGSPHEINERRMANWTRNVGWFTGALVVVSIVTACIFQRQLTVMQLQLAESKNQRLFTIAQLRANLRREPISMTPINSAGGFAEAGQQISAWIVNPKWQNVGAMDASSLLKKVFRGGP
jgi:hypothetical protein